MKYITLVILFLLGLTNVAFAQPREKYKQKEILRLAWGDRTQDMAIHTANTDSPAWISFGMDGKENYYLLDGGHQEIKVFDPSGHFLKRIKLKNDAGDLVVDDQGNIYLPDNLSSQLFLIDILKTDGTLIKTTIPWTTSIANGTAYGTEFKKKASAAEQMDLVEKDYDLAPYLTSVSVPEGEWTISPGWLSEIDYIDDRNSMVVRLSKVKKNLKNILPSEIRLEIPQESERTASEVIGVDELGKIYVLCISSTTVYPHYTEGAEIRLYSSDGNSVGTIPIDYKKYSLETPDRFKVDRQGNIFWLTTAKDGVHLFKWSKVSKN